MLRRILDTPQEELLAETRRVVAGLQAALARFDAAAEDQGALLRSAQQLDELFLLVVAGEFNAGKSTFINALLGQRLLEEGVTPTTTRIHRLRYGSEVSRRPLESGVEEVEAPVELLREIHIVDTPGTNAILREHEAITREFVPRSDLVLFVTSADRPFTESERGFLQGIREWGKKVVVVVNKIDILESPEEVEQIRRFIADNARDLLGATPEIFPVSSRLALRAKEAADPEALARSRFEGLERSIVTTLDERERVRLKLLNPLGVADHLSGRYQAVAEGRLDLLKEDVAAIEDVERQLALYKEDLEREFRFRLSDVDKVLHEFENRGMQFFDETVRLGRVFDLIQKERIKAEFEKKVVADLPREIERKVAEVIDWLVTAELRQWEAVMEHLARRRHEHADRIVGKVGGSFDLDRIRLLDSVGRAAQRVVETYDREGEASRLADSVQVAVAGTALVEVGAIGLGAVIAHAAVTAAADVTGLLAAGTLAALGLFILPHRRNRAKADLKAKIAELRERLMGSMTSQFDQEIEKSLRRIDQAIAPYTRFVRAERERLGDAREELAGFRGELSGLRGRVEAL
jgi:small GTP-binding protein